MASTPARTSFPKSEISVLLLENVHASADELFGAEGFKIERVRGALGEAELRERIRDVHVLGLRSKTRVTPAVLAEARRLLAVGAFCIGTNQIACDAAALAGVPVFNAPFANTRSVAELVLAEVVFLARQLGDRIREVHVGTWRKVSAGCHEVRGKTLGIVGYGHIGTQVGVLAEAFGMRVLYHDIVAKLAVGNVRPTAELRELLAASDFVTLHVPETPATRGMIGAAELAAMKPGAHLINASRGTVVDVAALAEALTQGHLAGAAIDVFPEEPEGNSDAFESPLRGLANVILTPHIGGSTEEAQANIGREVATALTKFVNAGATTGAVNFPHIELPQMPGTHRILNVHKNVPGVLRDINRIVSDLGANIRAQTLATDADIGYLIMDLDHDVSDEVNRAIGALPTSQKTRILY
ncbi:MAG: phosphoglycerate dehydrogenase [Kofleriaceae bacterium]